MLTADLVRAQRRAGELKLTPLRGAERERAIELSSQVLDVARGALGETRETLRDRWKQIDVQPKEVRLRDGLVKLVEDGCEIEAQLEVEPWVLRRELFEAASTARQDLVVGASWDRLAVLQRVGEKLGVDPQEMEQGLYADLRGAHRLRDVPRLSPEGLIDRYEEAQAQAVLLRAVEVVAEIRCKSPAAYRALFRKLKFRRLLHTITATERGYRVCIDGPYSLFDQVTKYGLQLALMLPAILDCDEVDLEATVVWGKKRDRLRFRMSHRGTGASASAPLPEEVEALLEAFGSGKRAWSVDPARVILQLPGEGLCVPDLLFRKGKHEVYLEVLGYWSREAVWRRVELVQAGLNERVLFAVSSRLRVSEEVLDPDESSALYVYKGRMSARAIEAKLNELVGR